MGTKKYLYKAMDRPQIKAKLLVLLAKGPATTGALAKRIHVDVNNTARLLTELHFTRKIERVKRERAGSTWRLATAKPPRERTYTTKTDVADDEEHARWMAYWRMPRAERKKMESLQ